ncbi:MAG: hypothetical protein GX334_05620 [Firmicutes bacterium]|jgi:hypothetical protein|nr:hypothetical protein [Bacillota bacterium]
MQRRADFLYGKATGIGSMPHREATAALELIQETMPWGPHWPQLPQRSKDEGLIQQYLGPLLKLELLDWEKGIPPFFVNDNYSWLEKAARFYELYLAFQEGKQKEEVLSLFAFPPAAAAGFYKFLDVKWDALPLKPHFLKGQVCGPLSLGLQVNAGDQTSAFYHTETREIITKALTLNARFQIHFLKKFSLPVVIMIDEPLLFFYGQLAGISLSREQIVQSLAELVSAIKQEGAYAGVHCCSGADWSIIFEVSPHIVSFDAYAYFDSLLVYGEQVQSFLNKGGCLAWGLIPTTGEDLKAEGAASLKEKFWKGIQRLARQGVNEGLLARQYLLTPSCGTGTLSVAQCSQVYSLTFDLQKLLQGHPG